MKTTVKLTPYKRITVQPCRLGGINLELVYGMIGKGHTTSELITLTPDQAGALVFGIEQANQSAQQQAAV